jgi:NAD(P)-dependent dehydrogenase (short-subunit alcohol dehydrogenase family)
MAGGEMTFAYSATKFAVRGMTQAAGAFSFYFIFSHP